MGLCSTFFGNLIGSVIVLPPRSSFVSSAITSADTHWSELLTPKLVSRIQSLSISVYIVSILLILAPIEGCS